MEIQGRPCVTVATDVFLPLAEREAEAFDLPTLPLVAVPHILTNMSDHELQRLGASIVDEILAGLVTNSREIS